jgi:hypothetical protein
MLLQVFLYLVVTIANLGNASPLTKRDGANGVIPKGTKALTVKQGPGSVVCIICHSLDEPKSNPG